MFENRETRKDDVGDADRHLKRAGAGPFTIIAEGTACQGKLKSENAIHIEGSLEGEVESNSVVVGENGFVKGKVIGEVVFVTGRIEGEIHAKALRLAHSAEVNADLTIRGTMSIDNGARLDGRISMSESKPKLKAIEGDRRTGTKSETVQVPVANGETRRLRFEANQPSESP